jgi:hypothetical protein
MQLTYRLTYRALLQGSRLQTNFVQVGLAVAGVMVATLVLTHLGDGTLPRSPIGVGRWLLLPVGGALAFGIAFTFAFWAVLLPFRVWLIHRQNPLLYGEMRLVADSDGIEVEGPRNTTRLLWSDIRGFKENSSVWVLCLSKSAGLSIPKEALPDSTVSEWVGLLRAKLSLL